MNQKNTEKLIHDIYKEVVKNNINNYIHLFKNTKIDSNTITYWKNATIFYNSLEKYEKNIFFDIINQIIIDTTTNLLYILDSYDYSSIKEFDNNLCDIFLELIENENKKYYK